MHPLYQQMATSVFERMSLAAAKHAKVERNHLWPVAMKIVPELTILIGNYRIIAAEVGSSRYERGQCRFVIDQQQPRQRH